MKLDKVSTLNDVMEIGMDIGRGYVKAYSVVNNKPIEIKFKAVIGEGRYAQIQFEKYDNPIYIAHEGMDYFVGNLAEKESYSPIRNSQDSKTSETVQVLLAAALNEMVTTDKVKINLGVPYKGFTRQMLQEVQETYKGKTMVVKNKLTNSTKSILIEDINIFRESDAALMYALKGSPNTDKPVGCVNVGFRTMELSYFDKGFIFNDKLSDTIEYGNSTMLKIIQDQLREENISKELHEIDSSDDYDDRKVRAYRFGSEKVNQIIEEKWINKDAMDLFLVGGTSIHLNPGDEFTKLPDAQMATAKGLYQVAKDYM